MQRKKQVQRNTDNTWSAGISLYLLLSKEGLCDFKSADESDSDFFFGKYGDSFNDAVH